MDHTDPNTPRSADALPGKAVAFWLDTTPETRFPSLRGDVAVDVAIVGGGIAGITTAFLLKQAGARVAVIDAGRVVSNVTGHTTAKITALHDLIYDHPIAQLGQGSARLCAEARQAAIGEITRLVRERGVDCDFRRTSAYTYTGSEQELESIAAEVQAVTGLGLPASYEERVPLPFPAKAAVRFADQSEFHPRKYLLALDGTVIQGPANEDLPEAHDALRPAQDD